MTKTELIKQLRETTAAGMNDCVSALKEANDDLQKAIDIIKAKGKNIVSGREGKIASEGLLASYHMDGGTGNDLWVCIEVNSETDFVSQMPEFADFAFDVMKCFSECVQNGTTPTLTDELEETRQDLIAKTKENIVVRRWWVEKAMENERVFAYRHSNKLEAAVVLTGENLDTDEIDQLGNDLCLQVAAMNPMTLSFEDLLPEVVSRQKEIIEEQIKEETANEKKTPNPKAIDGKRNGKLRKWKEEVCLLDQTSIIDSKKTVAELIKVHKNVSVKRFVRVQVGEGIQKAEENFAEEVAKMTEENK